jgi:lipid-A-disaccharide synthase
MLVAGEPSGDLIGAELVAELKSALAGDEFAPRFFGAGGPCMASAGVELDLDLTRHAVTGLSEVLKNLNHFRRLLRRLVDIACARRPDLIVLVDFQGFNRRLVRALRLRLRRESAAFHNWRPRIVQYVAPQVWASRPGRADALARDVDLLLCLFPFEKDWFAARVPRLRVEAVGHPILDRHHPAPPEAPAAEGPSEKAAPRVLLLPGSRRGELTRHLPPMLGAARMIAARAPVEFELVLPDANLRGEVEQQVRAAAVPVRLEVGGLARALAGASVAIASTGTVTLECALWRVPTVALYITAPVTYWIGRRVVTVKYLAMPNLLAGEPVFPEFIQHAATPENLASAALELLTDSARRASVRATLERVVGQLGEPGSSRRAATACVRLLRGERLAA